MTESSKDLLGFLIGFFSLIGVVFLVGLFVFIAALGVCSA